MARAIGHALLHRSEGLLASMHVQYDVYAGSLPKHVGSIFAMPGGVRGEEEEEEAFLFLFLQLFFDQKRSGSENFTYSWHPLGSLETSKSNGKTHGFSTFSLFGPTKPPHICIILAISCLEAHLFSVLLLFWPRSLKASKPRGASAGIAKRNQFLHRHYLGERRRATGEEGSLNETQDREGEL